MNMDATAIQDIINERMSKMVSVLPVAVPCEVHFRFEWEELDSYELHGDISRYGTHQPFTWDLARIFGECLGNEKVQGMEA